MLGRHGTFEGDTVCFGERVADAVFNEIEPLLLVESSLQIRGAANEAGLAFFADPALEDGFDEDRPVLLMSALMSSSLASGPSTSAAGYPANCNSFAP
jgi:hypothetical protein